MFLDKLKENKDVLFMNSKRYPEVTVCKYIHSNVDFSNNFTRTARALVLDNNGNVIARGFEKFFNYKELENRGYTQDFVKLYEIKDNQKLKAFTKQDGTFITVSVYNNNIICGTTGSLDTDFSINAENYFSKIDGLVEYLKESNTSILFEYTSPTNKIVLTYDEDKYFLLGEIKNDLNAKPFTDLSHLDKFNFNRNTYEYLTLSEILNILDNEENIEGYVITNENNKMIKLKTKWYFEKHKIVDLFMGNETNNKLRTLYQAYIENTLDDIIALRNQHYNNESTKYIIDFVNKLSTLETIIRKHYIETLKLTDKELGLYDLNNTIKSFVFRLRKSQPLFTERAFNAIITYFEKEK